MFVTRWLNKLLQLTPWSRAQAKSSSASQENPLHFMEQKLYYSVYNGAPVFAILYQSCQGHRPIRRPYTVFAITFIHKMLSY